MEHVDVKKDTAYISDTEVSETGSTHAPQTIIIESKGISVRRVIQTILSYNRLVLFVFAFFLLIGVISAVIYREIRVRSAPVQGYVRASVLFGFPNAEEGLDPLGNPLNVNMMRSPYVIGQALDYLDMRERGISAEDIRSNLNIYRVVPHDALDNILLIRETAARLPQRLEALEEVLFHSTQFILQMYRRGALSSLTESEMTSLLDAIVRAYQVYFIPAYSGFYFLDVVMGHFDPSTLDFPHIMQTMQGSLDNMVSYTEGMLARSQDFRSPSTQMTFRDIVTNLELLRDIELAQINAVVHVNNLSRDRARSADYLEYRVLRMQMEHDVAVANANDFLHLVTEVYEHQQWLLPYTHSEHHFFPRASELYGELLRNAQYYMILANELASDIAFYTTRIANLRTAQNPASAADIAFVEDAIPRILDSMRDWESVINRTADDFYRLDLYADAVRLVYPANFRMTYPPSFRERMVLIVLVFGAAGLFFAAMIALYKGERKIHQS